MRNRVKSYGIGNIHEIITFILFAIFILSLPFSESFISIAAGLILISQIISIFYRKNQIVQKLRDKSIWLISSIFLIYLIGLLFTNDIQLGLYELKKNVFWIVITLGIALSPKLTEQKFWILLDIFIFGVIVSSLISFLKLFFNDALEFENFRDVNFVSHISFSFQVTLSAIILIYSFIYHIPYLSKINLAIRILTLIWFLFFLVILKSMLGLVAFYFMSIVLVYYLLKNIKTKRIRLWLISVSVLVFISPVVYVSLSVVQFYNIKDSKDDAINAITDLGNNYVHYFNNKQKENGHYVYWFICEDELIKAWNSRSETKYNEKNSEGYRISATLKRYLTSKGFHKDSTGVSQLTERDVLNIQSGIANCIYDAPMLAIYPRIYGTIWEMDQYFLTGNPNDQSLSQRIEYAKASIYIIKHNFWLGIGTGNYKEEFEQAFKNINSKLKVEHYDSSHNQYLSYFLKFGLVGFLLILSIIILVIYRKKHFRNQIFILFLINMLVGNLGDANWETHVGLAYFVFFFSLFLWHSPKSIKGFDQ